MDNKTATERHDNMSAVHGKNTKPEIMVRHYLFSRGLRFRIHDKKLPGCPDIVLKKYKTVIFVNGCFWHGHRDCKYATVPATNKDFWERKIQANRERDESDKYRLELIGWKVLTIWTCEIRNKLKRQESLEKLYASIINNFNPT